ncbi:HAD family hydrolase [Thioalkalivibrio denitrificans]|uniref:HAD family hydrolase n=1 Tax=Thioalkalivibrio denitrificans TaxID=108003 RepID=A0A1V3NHI7_9GAMM|nr:HAD-IA family hydrolase [Thioalkalivibrio denitrificans]OOG24520.1 HAD family hydrolase [Thioalkalivibrio denitrificans]
MSSKPYQLLVFDWDGTLMDSAARIVSCLRGAIADTGAEERDESALRDIIGLGLDEAILALYPGAGNRFLADFREAYRVHFLERDETPSALFPGVGEMLAALESAGYWLAVATGKSRRGLDRVLDDTGLARHFLSTRCADETFSKPNPAMLNEIMNELGLGPEDTLMIGDSEYDMLMASNAGTDRLGVTYGVHGGQRLSQHSPVALMDDLRVLPGWLSRTVKVELGSAK